MSLLRAGVVTAQIRVGVSITSTGNTAQATTYNKLTAVTQCVIPAAAVAHVYIVLGVVLDSIGYNKFLKEIQVVGDQAALGVGKRFYEVQAITDSTTYLLFKKGSLETLFTTESRTFTMAKQFADTVHATDDFYGNANVDDDEVMLFSKTLTVEQQHVADVAHSSIGKRATDTVSKSDVESMTFGKTRTDTATTSETKSFVISKNLTDTLHAGDEFNATALTDDGEVMVFGKSLFDSFTQADFVSVQAEKATNDTATVGDELLPFELGKGIADTPVTAETLAFSSDKPLEDAVAFGDTAAMAIGRKVADRAYYGDGPNLYDTYALAYFAEDYVREGFPALWVYKTLADTVHSTDDFYGVANADDDEVMQFGKLVSDLAASSDLIRHAANKVASDLFTIADTATIGSSKALADTVGKSDTATKSAGKTAADVVTSSEIVVRSAGKGASDSATTGEYKTFALSKALVETVAVTDDFLGNANADDDETMLLNKAVSDSFTKSDSVSKGPGKGLADTASTSESGSMVWTDYWDVNYTVTTSGVYVGNSQSF